LKIVRKWKNKIYLYLIREIKIMKYLFYWMQKQKILIIKKFIIWKILDDKNYFRNLIDIFALNCIFDSNL